ncbi:1059_t:CDS:2 [Diversispora eburnea]|uniref:1059_t:CDS:1 n=1 Tax=Diversispora eburnea TaxID=1213867 RepID=A0A9N8Z9E2_9GLOM|nr:1059_t:CDS:2 [Diversispora eburnea]
MTSSSTEQTSADSSVSAFTSALIFNGAITFGLFITFDIIRKRVKKVYEPRSHLLPRRFMKMFTIIFMIFTIIGIGILLPINYIGQLGQSGLDQFTMGNVSDKNRLYFHVGAAYIFTGIMLYMMYRETNIYIKFKHAYCTTHEYQKSPRATTIYVPDIPSHLIHNEEEFKKLYNAFPGGVKKIWFNRYPKKLIEAQSERQKIINGLELAETAFIRNYDKQFTESKEIRDEDLKKFRPISRSKLGMKQDAIEFNRKRLIKFNNRNELIFTNLNSAFIQFKSFMGAQLAANSTATRITDISPDDIIWENLNIAYSQRLVRKVIITFVAAISKLSELGKIIPFLEPAIDSLPITVLGIIEGILPALALAILMIILSLFLRGVEISLQKKYYFFLIINVLLVTSFANGVFEAISPIIENPPSIVNTLAEKLPLASTFFLTYVLLSISGSAIELLQIGPLVMYLGFKKFFRLFQFSLGICIYQLLMIGLMFLNQAFIPGVLMIVLLGLTITFIILKEKFIFKRNPYAKFLSGKYIISELDIPDSRISIGDTSSFEGGDSKGSEEGIQEIKKGEAIFETGDDDEDNYYAHPAFYATQSSVWLPQDPARLSIKEIEECQNQGIKATNQGASLKNNKIVVDLNDVPVEIEFVKHYHFGEYIRQDDYLH